MALSTVATSSTGPRGRSSPAIRSRAGLSGMRCRSLAFDARAKASRSSNVIVNENPATGARQGGRWRSSSGAPDDSSSSISRKLQDG